MLAQLTPEALVLTSRDTTGKPDWRFAASCRAACWNLTWQEGEMKGRTGVVRHLPAVASTRPSGVGVAKLRWKRMSGKASDVDCPMSIGGRGQPLHDFGRVSVGPRIV